MIPEQHRQFVDKLLDEHGVPKLPAGEKPVNELLGWTAATASAAGRAALKHEKVRLIANALGTPPDDVIAEIHAAGRQVAALCAARPSTRSPQERRHRYHHRSRLRGRRPHRRNRQRRPVARGDRCGRADAGAAAGGIGSGRQIAAALAMGAQGVWTGRSG